MKKLTPFPKRGMSCLDSLPFQIVDDAGGTSSQAVTGRSLGKGGYALGQFTTI